MQSCWRGGWWNKQASAAKIFSLACGDWEGVEWAGWHFRQSERVARQSSEARVLPSKTAWALPGRVGRAEMQ